jgi:uncharacterized protein (TIGR03086 family)
MAEQPGPADEFRAIAGRFSAVVAGVVDWSSPTPVPEWRARDVVGHLAGWFPSFLANGSGITLPRGQDAAENPLEAWAAMSGALQAVLDDPAQAAAPFSNPHTGAMTVAEAVARFFTADVFMHTWDLARATGQDDTLDPARCAEMFAGMLPMDGMLRASGHYGPRVAVPEDADAQTKLLAFIGRDPAWRPATPR